MFLKNSLIIFSFVSCGQFAHKKNTPLDPLSASKKFNQVVRSICVDGEGKGRLEMGQDRQLVTYESALDVKKHLWSLAFQIPLHGEEIIHLEYKNIKNGSGLIRGNLAQKIASQVKSMAKEERQLIKKFFEIFAQLISFHHQLIVDKNELNCLDDEQGNWKCGNESAKFEVFFEQNLNNIVLRRELDTQHKLEIELADLNQNHYKKTSAAILSANSGVILGLKLFSASCN